VSVFAGANVVIPIPAQKIEIGMKINNFVKRKAY
jgi:hypothetical protein